ncbi:hypothetical protein BOO69_08280 [Sulfitobacter alexandrii]|uniref:Uncharacterized protein n=1 Tax=Sulfitobacter alexandrii TaxID=1917485 RepID=A0A1J0WGF6_9RHOB|nr:hypothetical protein [Sulfitobacter alexandrii]APE43413.1 hypothetical protein BOO69_08280 [Sulfitobacter alexandrii]
MKIRVLEDAHHRLGGARSQSFRANGGSEGKGIYDVPKATADALIARKVAEAFTGPETRQKEA